MDHIAQPTDYRLTPNTLSFALNILGEANRVQCSVSSGASIKCFIEDVTGLDYNSNHEYREWPVIVAPTYFNTDTIKYIYAAIPKTSASGTAAMIVFPSEQLDIYGKNAQNEQIGPTTHFFIWLQGIISAVTTTDDVSTRQMTQLVNDGSLGTEQYRAAKMITSIKVNGTAVQIEGNTAEITTPQAMSDLTNDENYIEESDITHPGNKVIKILDTTIDFSHNHDWGDIVNKPNLLEGITIGANKLSFLHSNGDTTTADFSAIMTALNGKASVTSVQNLVNSRGMVIDPYVWATTYNLDNEDWTDCEGEYWYDSSASKLKICAGFILGVPQFVELRGMFLVWHDTAGQLSLYTYYGSGTPTLTTIFTA